MSKLTQLTLTQFRNLETCSLPLSDGMNIIVGDNAAGKTSIIEAIWMLSTGRSFRTAQTKQCIHYEQSELTVFAEVIQQKQTHKLGLQKTQHQSTLRVNGETVKQQSELANKLPVQLLTPESHRLLEEGPKVRRQFIDWGCFHHSESFIHHWRQYRRILKQRNHALKKRLPKAQIQLWDHALVENALMINQTRTQYIESLTPYLTKFCDTLMPELTSHPKLSYRAGWLKDSDYLQLLTESFQKDLQAGFTQYGPHRADIRFKFNQLEALQTLSRGQQKLFVCALLLAQASYYEKEMNEPVIMLIDDLPAELDQKHRKTLLDLLNLLNIQHIVTTTDLSLINTDNQSKQWVIRNNHVRKLN